MFVATHAMVGTGNYAAAAYDRRRHVSIYGNLRGQLEWDGTNAMALTRPGLPLVDWLYDNDGMLVYDARRQRLLYYDGQELWGLTVTPTTVSDLGFGCGAGTVPFGTPFLTARGAPVPGRGEYLKEKTLSYCT